MAGSLIQSTNGGGYDAFVTKISDSPTNQFPVCSAAQANPAALWSPNYQSVPVVVNGVTDPDGNALTITVTGVTQDEPVKTTGGNNRSPDAVIEAGAASVRAERSGTGIGRVYQISFTAADGKGQGHRFAAVLLFYVSKSYGHRQSSLGSSGGQLEESRSVLPQHFCCFRH